MASAALASILLATTGCWPAVPIAAMVNANRSGSSHHPPATVTIQGTIVTDATVFPPPPSIESLPPAGTGPVLDLSATDVDFGLTGTNLVVQARNAGDGTLVVDPNFTASPVVGPDTSWLDVALLADGKTIQLTPNRTGVADGPYQVKVDVESNGGFGSFLVDLTVGGTTPTPIGPVIVDVIAADGVTRVARVTTTAVEGYAWTVPGLPLGKYFIEAGVDLDSNGVIGEPGEPFGAYPSAFDPKTALDADGVSVMSLDLVVR